MPQLVRLHVFSQRADPSWYLSEEQEREFGRRLLGLRAQSLLKAQGGVPTFGYRGFSLSLLPTGGPLMRINQGIVDTGPFEVSFIDPERTIEKFLLDTASAEVSTALRQEILAALSLPVEELWNKRGKQRPAGPVCTPRAEDAPKYNPSIWNDLEDIRRENNCYNYALDKILNNSAIPGSTNGVPILYSDCKARHGPEEAAKADGLRITPDFSTKLAKGQGWYVALALKVDFSDCHWYRQDASGCWSHKLGSGAASNLDDDGEFITDPEYCAPGVYSNFCTYMIVGPDVDIEGDDDALLSLSVALSGMRRN